MIGSSRRIALSCFLAANLFARLTAQEGPVFAEGIKTEHFELLDYPRLAEAARIQGIVAVRVTLDYSGHVTSSRAIAGPEVLIADCLENSKKWSFGPSPSRVAVIFYHFMIDPNRYCQGPCASHSSFYPPNVITVVTGMPPANQ